MVDKSNRYLNLGLLFLVVAALVLIPGASALPVYFSTLTSVYGPTGHSCGTCHVNSSGGGERNAYGTLFENQPNHTTNPKAALVAIGAPPGLQTTTAMSTPSITETPAPTVVEQTTAPTETPAEAASTPLPVPTNKSPGIGIVAAIGIIGIIYAIRRKK